MSLLCYLHENKVASSNQLRLDIFKSSIQKTRRRLKQLRDAHMLETLNRIDLLDRGVVYSLTKFALGYLKKIYPNMFFINRVRSNSIDHDLRLVDIRRALTSKKLVTKYWTENQLQTSIDVTHDLVLSTYRSLQVDALVKLDNKMGDSLLCALEYEASIKSNAAYKDKMKMLYSIPQVGVILYICLDEEVERVVKSSELNLANTKSKKIYYANYLDVIKSDSTVVFQNQDGSIIEVF